MSNLITVKMINKSADRDASTSTRSKSYIGTISMNIYSGKPFTYYICWSNLDIHYYGVRFANGCNPTDLWTKYFTSSDRVKEFRKIHGEPDVIQIRKIFEDIQDARIWESRVLRKMKVKKRSNWLNDGMGMALNWKSGKEHQNYGRVFSAESKLKQSISKSKLRWWNNGEHQCFSQSPPDSSYKRGRLKFNNVGAQIGADISKMKKWYTNGIDSIFVIPGTQPSNYVEGRIIKNRSKPNPLKGSKWWSNGVESRLSFDSPGPEWTLGRPKV